MENQTNFWLSFEQYIKRGLSKNPIPFTYYVMAIVLLALVTSTTSIGNSVVASTNISDVIDHATSVGDYDLARGLYPSLNTTDSELAILGSESELEDKVYPERKVERRISELQSKLELYPGSVEIYRSLSELYGQLGNTDLKAEYREKIRILDPNDTVSK